MCAYKLGEYILEYITNLYVYEYINIIICYLMTYDNIKLFCHYIKKLKD